MHLDSYPKYRNLGTPPHPHQAQSQVQIGSFAALRPPPSPPVFKLGQHQEMSMSHAEQQVRPGSSIQFRLNDQPYQYAEKTTTSGLTMTSNSSFLNNLGSNRPPVPQQNKNSSFSYRYDRRGSAQITDPTVPPFKDYRRSDSYNDLKPSQPAKATPVYLNSDYGKTPISPSSASKSIVSPFQAHLVHHNGGNQSSFGQMTKSKMIKNTSLDSSSFLTKKESYKNFKDYLNSSGAHNPAHKYDQDQLQKTQSAELVSTPRQSDPVYTTSTPNYSSLRKSGITSKHEEVESMANKYAFSDSNEIDQCIKRDLEKLKQSKLSNFSQELKAEDKVIETKEKKQLATKNIAFERELQLKNQEIYEKNNQLVEKSQQIIDKNREVSELKHELALKNTLILELKSQMQEQSNREQSIRDELNRKIRIIEGIQRQVSTQQALFKEQESRLSQQILKIEAVTNQRRHQESIKEVELFSRINELEKDVAAKESMLIESGISSSALTSRIVALEQEIRRNHALVSASRGEVEVYKDQITAQENKQRYLSFQLEQVNNELKEVTRRQSLEIQGQSEIMKELETVQSEKNKLMVQLAGSEQTKSSLSNECRRLQQECLSLKSQVSSQKERQARQVSLSQQKEEKISRLEQEVSRVRIEYAQILSIVGPLDPTHSSLKQKLKKIMAKPQAVDKPMASNSKQQDSKALRTQNELLDRHLHDLTRQFKRTNNCLLKTGTDLEKTMLITQQANKQIVMLHVLNLNAKYMQLCHQQ